jgi:hypothetical protein
MDKQGTDILATQTTEEIAGAQCEETEGFLHCQEPARHTQRGQKRDALCAGTYQHVAGLQNYALVKKFLGITLHTAESHIMIHTLCMQQDSPTKKELRDPSVARNRLDL